MINLQVNGVNGLRRRALNHMAATVFSGDPAFQTAEGVILIDVSRRKNHVLFAVKSVLQSNVWRSSWILEEET